MYGEFFDVHKDCWQFFLCSFFLRWNNLKDFHLFSKFLKIETILLQIGLSSLGFSSLCMSSVHYSKLHMISTKAVFFQFWEWWRDYSTSHFLEGSIIFVFLELHDIDELFAFLSLSNCSDSFPNLLIKQSSSILSFLLQIIPKCILCLVPLFHCILFLFLSPTLKKQFWILRPFSKALKNV